MVLLEKQHLNNEIGFDQGEVKIALSPTDCPKGEDMFEVIINGDPLSDDVHKRSRIAFNFFDGLGSLAEILDDNDNDFRDTLVEAGIIPSDFDTSKPTTNDGYGIVGVVMHREDISLSDNVTTRFYVFKGDFELLFFDDVIPGIPPVAIIEIDENKDLIMQLKRERLRL